MTTSIPYTKENWLSPVATLRIVLVAYRMLGNSSTHYSFAPSSRLHKMLINVLLRT